jgi:acetolactate synthase II small subunit
MTSDLWMVVRREEGVLVRVIGLIVRRGFEPVRVEAHTNEDGNRLRIGLTLESNRPVEVLARHLAKLNEVERVDVMRPETEE